MPLLIMAVPIFDTISVIMIRVNNKTSIFTADKNHISHRLIKRGMSRKQALSVIYLISFCIGLGALLLSYLDIRGCFLVLIQAGCIILIIALLEGVGD
jgi:UDP-GlcNAc:undecaprenyl-phosphate GlcNAc-1-phosphate transferase